MTLWPCTLDAVLVHALALDCKPLPTLRVEMDQRVDPTAQPATTVQRSS